MLFLVVVAESLVVAPFVRMVPFIYRTDKQARGSVKRAVERATLLAQIRCAFLSFHCSVR